MLQPRAVAAAAAGVARRALARRLPRPTVRADTARRVVVAAVAVAVQVVMAITITLPEIAYGVAAIITGAAASTAAGRRTNIHLLIQAASSPTEGINTILNTAAAGRPQVQCPLRRLHGMGLTCTDANSITTTNRDHNINNNTATRAGTPAHHLRAHQHNRAAPREGRTMVALKGAGCPAKPRKCRPDGEVGTKGIGVELALGMVEVVAQQAERTVPV
ncbi:unnamed protein product, partial [Sphacelaria rigidula]